MMGGSIVLTDVLHMYVIHAHGLYWRLHLHHRSLLLPLLLPNLSEVWPLFTGVRGGASYISGGGLG